MSDPKKRQAKSERNTTLIKKELENNPTDIRMICMMAQEYGGGDYKESEQEVEYCNRGLELIQDNLRSALIQIKYKRKIYPSQVSIFYFQLYCMKTTALSKMDKWEELIETSKRYFTGKPNENLSDLTIYYNLCNAYDHLEQWEDALKNGDCYIELFDKMQQKGFETDEVVANTHIINSIDKYYVILKGCIRFCINIEKYSSIFVYLNKLPVKDVDFFSIFHGLNKSKDTAILIGVYDYLNKSESPEKIEEFFFTAERYIFHSDMDKKQLIHSLASIEQDDSIHYILLNKMRDCYLLENIEEAKKILFQLREVKTLHRLLSDVIYYSLKEKQDISVLFDSVRVEELVYYIQDIRANHPDFPELILEYFSINSSSYQYSVKALHWSVHLLEPSILMLQDKKGQSDTILTLLCWYLEVIILYAQAIYHPDLLQGDRISDLPAPARFAYYVELAQASDQRGDELGYYRNMAQAVDQYKVMAKPMKLLTDYHRKEQELKQGQRLQDNQELVELAAQVKKQLHSFVEQKTIPRQKRYWSDMKRYSQPIRT